MLSVQDKYVMKVKCVIGTVRSATALSSQIMLLLLLLPALSYSDINKVFSENSRAVVTVTAYNRNGEALTEGTGFVAGKEGIVVTNFHVISIASSVKVKIGGKVMDAVGIIYEDRANDIMILKVKGNNLPSVRFGEHSRLNKGDSVYIISSNEGSGNIISSGIFRGLKEMSQKRKVLQFTAPVTHGSSGSPVLNDNGEVVGIVTFLIKRGQKLVLAMPVDSIVERIRHTGTVVSMDKALRSYKNSPDHWFYLGYFLIEAGAHKDAVDVLKEAVRLRPDHADAYYYLGAAYEELKTDEKAADAYRKAVKAAPDFSDAYFRLGMAYGRLGRYKDAVEAFKQAVRSDPDHADAHYNLCLTYLLLKDKKSAEGEYRILKELSPELADKLRNGI